MRNIFVLIIALSLCVSCNAKKKESSDRNVKIQLIRNATLKINYGDTTFLVDPMLGGAKSFMSFVEQGKNLNPTVNLPLSLDKVLNDVDAVLLTHNHPDHFDKRASEVINKEVPIFVQPDDVVGIKKAGFKRVNSVEKRLLYNGFEIIRTGGKHGPEQALEMLGNVSGFILKKANFPSIYIVGDCLWDDEIKGNIKKYSPDIIITNSGGAEYMNNKILMDANATIEVAKYAPQAKVVAVHMNSIDHCKTTRDILAAEAKKSNIRILIPKDGEIVEL